MHAANMICSQGKASNTYSNELLVFVGMNLYVVAWKDVAHSRTV